MPRRMSSHESLTTFAANPDGIGRKCCLGALPPASSAAPAGMAFFLAASLSRLHLSTLWEATQCSDHSLQLAAGTSQT